MSSEHEHNGDGWADLFRQPVTPGGDPDEAARAEAVRQADEEARQLEAAVRAERLRNTARKRAQDEAEKDDASARGLSTVTTAHVPMRRVHWLWDGRIPLGECTLIVGKGGTGKSTILAEMTSWITNGTMRGEYLGEPRDVLYIPNEDSLAYTIVPRMHAAGADLSRVHMVSATDHEGNRARVKFPMDCDRIARMAAQFEAPVVFVDPLSSCLTARPNDADEVRNAMEHLRSMAEFANIAVVGLGHTRKAQYTSILEGLMGSSEMGNVLRSVMGVMADTVEVGTYLLSPEKHNLGPALDSYRYRINTATFDYGGELIETSRIEWLGSTPQSVRDLLEDAQNATGGEALRDAVDWLRDYLERQGPTVSTAVVGAAMEDGHSRPTLYRAAKRLGVVKYRPEFGGKSTWSLPMPKPTT